MSEMKTRQTVHATLQIDNDHVRVTEYRFKPGSETQWHQHKWDYVVIPQTDGELLLIDAAGKDSRTDLVQGQSYYRKASVEHNVINVGSNELVFIEVEMKAYPMNP